MKTLIINQRSPVPSILTVVFATAFIVSAIWLSVGLKTYQKIDTRLKAAEISVELAEEKAALKITEKQHVYLQELRNTVGELEHLKARQEIAQETLASSQRPTAAQDQMTKPLVIQPLLNSEDRILTPPPVREKIALAENYLKARRYYKALEVAKEIDGLTPDFPGSEYIRFQVNKEMGFQNIAARSAEKIIKAAPLDSRTKPQYLYLIDHYLQNGREHQAEKIFRQAITNWPEDTVLEKKLRIYFGDSSLFNAPVENRLSRPAAVKS